MTQDAVHHSPSRASCEEEQDEPCEGEETWLSEEQQHQPTASDDAVQTPQDYDVAATTELQSHWAEYAYTEPRQCHILRRDEDAWLSPVKQVAPIKRLERIPRSWQVLSKVQLLGEENNNCLPEPEQKLQDGGEEQFLKVPPGIVAVAVTKPRPRAKAGAPRHSSQRQHPAPTLPSFR